MNGRRTKTMPVAAVLAAVMGVATRSAPAESGPVHCIPAGIEEKVKALIEDPGFAVPVAGDLSFEYIRIDRDAIVYSLVPVGSEDRDAAVAEIVLRPRALASPGETTSKSFVIRSDIQADSPQVSEAVATAMRSIGARDDGDFYIDCGSPMPPPAPPRRPTSPWPFAALAVLLTVVLAFVAGRHDARLGRSRGSDLGEPE